MDSFCTKCGTPGSGAFCADCGQPRDAALAPAAVAPVGPVAVSASPADHRHGLPALLSFFFPSFGQLVKGDFTGAAVVLAFFTGFLVVVVAGAPAFAVGFPIVWLWQVYDAYTAPGGVTKREMKRLGRRSP